MKNGKGITLISLIITIIVMLILATATVSMIIGEKGIISKAYESVDKMEKQEIYEKIVAGAVYDSDGIMDINETFKNTKENLGEDNIKDEDIKEDKISFKITGKRKHYDITIEKNDNEIEVKEEVN